MFKKFVQGIVTEPSHQNGQMQIDKCKAVKMAFDVFKPNTGSSNTEEKKSDIILIPGGNSCRHTWDIFVQDLANGTGRTVYTIDLRNNGDSPWNRDTSPESYVNDLVCFMEEQEITKAVLVGHSLGGYVAMCMGMLKPEKVEKIIVEDSTSRILPLKLRRIFIDYLKIMTKIVDSLPRDMDLQTAKKQLAERINNTSKSSKTVSSPMIETNGLPIVKKDGKFLLQTNPETFEDYLTSEDHRFPKGFCVLKALIIYGTRSPFFDRSVDQPYILAQFPQAKFHGMPNASHYVHSQFPEEYLKVIMKFINEP